MAKMLTLRMTKGEAAEIEAALQNFIDETRRLHEQTAEDRSGTERLQAETAVIAAESRAIGGGRETTDEEARTYREEARAFREEAKAFREDGVIHREKMKALRQETLAAIASIGAY